MRRKSAGGWAAASLLAATVAGIAWGLPWVGDALKPRPFQTPRLLTIAPEVLSESGIILSAGPGESAICPALRGQSARMRNGPEVLEPQLSRTSQWLERDCPPIVPASAAERTLAGLGVPKKALLESALAYVTAAGTPILHRLCWVVVVAYKPLWGGIWLTSVPMLAPDSQGRMTLNPRVIHPKHKQPILHILDFVDARSGVTILQAMVAGPAPPRLPEPAPPIKVTTGDNGRTVDVMIGQVVDVDWRGFNGPLPPVNDEVLAPNLDAPNPSYSFVAVARGTADITGAVGTCSPAPCQLPLFDFRVVVAREGSWLRAPDGIREPAGPL